MEKRSCPKNNRKREKMNRDKLEQALECLMDKIEKESKKETNNSESIFTLTKALNELVSIRASFPA
jgi:hypothetical protein